MAKRSGWSDRRIAALIAASVVLSRLPFVSGALATWDSVLLARALDLGFHVGTDLADQRPQAPGNLFYVGTAALVRPLVGSPNAALVAVSVIASALTCAVIYLFCRSFASRGGALVAAGVYATGPLVWSFGEVATPYAVLGLLSALLGMLFWRGRHGTATATLGASVAFGIATGFRQDLVLLLAPLWLWMIWLRPRLWIAAAMAATAGALAWFAPSAIASGGLAAYLNSVEVQSSRAAAFSVAVRGATGAADNAATIVYSLGWALAATFPVLLIAALARLVARRPSPGARALFFALWILPALVFYAGVHVGSSGYLLSVVPAVSILAGLLFDAVAPAARASSRRVAGAIAGAALVANALIFIAAPTPFSATAIAAHDRSLTDRVAYIRAQYPANGTVILAQYEFVFLTQYLPEYRALFFGPRPEVLSTDPPAVTVTPAGGTVLLFGRIPDLPNADDAAVLLPGLASLTRGSIRAYDIRMR